MFLFSSCCLSRSLETRKFQRLEVIFIRVSVYATENKTKSAGWGINRQTGTIYKLAARSANRITSSLHLHSAAVE